MNAYDRRHAKRYALSLEALRPHLKPGMAVLECGQFSSFGETLLVECGVSVRDTGFCDVRSETLSFVLSPPAPFDVVLCMEVFEHLHDLPPKGRIPTEWDGSGARTALGSMYALLKPGGLLFLTTPNACSLDVLHKVLSHQPPMVYRPHVREYAPHELAALVRDAGFESIEVTTHDCWDNDCMPAGMPAKLRDAIGRLGFRTDARGQDIFLTARKPVSRK